MLTNYEFDLLPLNIPEKSIREKTFIFNVYLEYLSTSHGNVLNVNETAFLETFTINFQRLFHFFRRSFFQTAASKSLTLRNLSFFYSFSKILSFINQFCCHSQELSTYVDMYLSTTRMMVKKL